jgi:hypothetical protein
MQLDVSLSVPTEYAVGASLWGLYVMRGTKTGQFNCPHCDALYHLIESEAGPETVDIQLTFVACDAPLPAREGPVIFKYFRSSSSPPRRKKPRKS